MDFYREDEIFDVKLLLNQYVDGTQCPAAQPHFKKRIGENKIERTADDILSIFIIVDECGLRSKFPLFCAVRLSRLPVIADDVSDMATLKRDLECVKKQVCTIVNTTSALKTAQPSCENTELTKLSQTEKRHSEFHSACIDQTIRDEVHPVSVVKDTSTSYPANTTSPGDGYAATARQLRESNPESWTTVAKKEKNRIEKLLLATLRKKPLSKV